MYIFSVQWQLRSPGQMTSFSITNTKSIIFICFIHQLFHCKKSKNQTKYNLHFLRRSCYTASKHAVQGFFDSLRAEVADKNVRVSVISPGYISTNLSVNAVTGDGSSYGGEGGNHNQSLDRKTQ